MKTTFDKEYKLSVKADKGDGTLRVPHRLGGKPSRGKRRKKTSKGSPKPKHTPKARGKKTPKGGPKPKGMDKFRLPTKCPDLTNTWMKFWAVFKDCPEKNPLARMLGLEQLNDEDGNVRIDGVGKVQFKLPKPSFVPKKRRVRTGRLDKSTLTKEETHYIHLLGLPFNYVSYRYVEELLCYVRGFALAMGATECKNTKIVTASEGKVVACVQCGENIDDVDSNFRPAIRVGRDKFVYFNANRHDIPTGVSYVFPEGKRVYTVCVGTKLNSGGKGKRSMLALVPRSMPPPLTKQRSFCEYEKVLARCMADPRVMMDRIKVQLAGLKKQFHVQGAKDAREEIRAKACVLYSQIKCLSAFCSFQESVLLKHVFDQEEMYGGESSKYKGAVREYHAYMKRRAKTPTEREAKLVDSWGNVEATLDEMDMAAEAVRRSSHRLTPLLRVLLSATNGMEEEAAPATEPVKRVEELLFAHNSCRRGGRNPQTIRFAYTHPDTPFDQKSGHVSSCVTFDTLLMWINGILCKAVARMTTQWKLKVGLRPNGKRYPVTGRTPYKHTRTYIALENMMLCEEFRRLFRKFPLGEGTFDPEDRLWIDPSDERKPGTCMKQPTHRKKKELDKLDRKKKRRNAHDKNQLDGKRAIQKCNERLAKEAKEAESKRKAHETRFDLDCVERPDLVKKITGALKKLPMTFLFNDERSNPETFHRLFKSRLETRNYIGVEELFKTIKNLLCEQEARVLVAAFGDVKCALCKYTSNILSKGAELTCPVDDGLICYMKTETERQHPDDKICKRYALCMEFAEIVREMLLGKIECVKNGDSDDYNEKDLVKMVGVLDEFDPLDEWCTLYENTGGVYYTSKDYQDNVGKRTHGVLVSRHDCRDASCKSGGC